MDPDYALFARVVAAGSLSAAGREAGLSASMVSKRMARLEQRLGVQLLHRTTRRLALTEAGGRFHGELVEILARLAEAEGRLTGSGAAGRLRVSAPTSFGRLHVAPYLHHFMAAYPRVELSFNVSDSYLDLIGGEVDIAVRITARVEDGLDAVRLASNRRVICATPAYCERAGMPQSVSDLARHRLLAAEGQIPWRLTDGAHQATVDHRPALRTNSSEIVRELALAGGGIALRSLWDVGDALRKGRLLRVLPEWEGSHDVAIYAVRRRSPFAVPAVEAFIAFLAEHIHAEAWNDI